MCTAGCWLSRQPSRYIGRFRGYLCMHVHDNHRRTVCRRRTSARRIISTLVVERSAGHAIGYAWRTENAAERRGDYRIIPSKRINVLLSTFKYKVSGSYSGPKKYSVSLCPGELSLLRRGALISLLSLIRGQ